MLINISTNKFKNNITNKESNIYNTNVSVANIEEYKKLLEFTKQYKIRISDAAEKNNYLLIINSEHVLIEFFKILNNNKHKEKKFQFKKFDILNNISYKDNLKKIYKLLSLLQAEEEIDNIDIARFKIDDNLYDLLCSGLSNKEKNDA